MSYASLFFGFRGRFSPGRYWGGLLMGLFLVLAADVQVRIFAGAMPMRGFDGLAAPATVLVPLVLLYVAYLLVTIHIRRLHDLDRSGWYVLLALVSVVGVVPLVLICAFVGGTTGPNRFGADPRFEADETVAVFDR